MPQNYIRFDHVRLDVSAISAAEEFYAHALGLQRVVCYEVGQRVILQMAPDGVPPGVELWMEDGLTPEAHRTQHVAFSVADVCGLVAKVRALGYNVLREPFAIHQETVAFVADPDGHIIELNDFRGRNVGEAGTPGRITPPE